MLTNTPLGYKPYCPCTRWVTITSAVWLHTRYSPYSIHIASKRADTSIHPHAYSVANRRQIRGSLLEIHTHTLSLSLSLRDTLSERQLTLTLYTASHIIGRSGAGSQSSSSSTVPRQPLRNGGDCCCWALRSFLSWRPAKRCHLENTAEHAKCAARSRRAEARQGYLGLLCFFGCQSQADGSQKHCCAQQDLVPPHRCLSTHCVCVSTEHVGNTDQERMNAFWLHGPARAPARAHTSTQRGVCGNQ